MTQHTPGPWAVADWSKGPNGEASSYHPFPVIAGSNGHGVAEVLMGQKKGMANARLIAAAPELLEACRVALAGLLPYEKSVSRNNLEAAIAKAEGTP